ncbi:hypothetical protein [Paraburkholderia fungorum]|uniref:hypothetical protein n=1 Tax=Paraburkholderia fungorum TaxID=134537 RepID=UPI0038B6B386
MENRNAASQQAQGKITVGAIGGGWWPQYAHLPSLKLLHAYDPAAVSSRNSGMRVDPRLGAR